MAIKITNIKGRHPIKGFKRLNVRQRVTVKRRIRKLLKDIGVQAKVK